MRKPNPRDLHVTIHNSVAREGFLALLLDIAICLQLVSQKGAGGWTKSVQRHGYHGTCNCSLRIRTERKFGGEWWRVVESGGNTLLKI